MAVTFTEKQLPIESNPGVRVIKVTATVGAGSDTGGSYTFAKPFRATPDVVAGPSRRDAVASVITGRISAISATALTLLHASATGSEVFDITLAGELAAQ